MSETYDQILSHEYFPEFDEIRKKQMAMSFFKYGPVKINMTQKLCDMDATIEKRWQAWKESHNTEYLADIANMCMMQWKYPQHEDAFYKATDSETSPGTVGMGINQIKSFEAAL